MKRDRDISRLLHELGAHVTESPASLSPSIQKAALSGSAVPEDAQTYIDKVRLHAYKVTDGDVEHLKAAEWSEDQIFELTVAAALGVGLSRLDQAIRALQEAGPR